MLKEETETMQLDAAQTNALATMKLHTESDILITGPAGTGKTRVLLEALLEAKSSGAEETPRLITFSRTLAKYDGHRAMLIAPEADYKIITSETFFWQTLIRKEPDHKVDYDLLRLLIPKINKSSMSDGELWIEIEEFLFGLNITREEYIEALVPRQGLKTGLNRREREDIWEMRENLAREMISRKKYSKHFARLRLLGWLENDINAPAPKGPLFVDESQDMAAVELLCLKALANGPLIMAGDTGQSIYGFVNPYRRAGLQLPQERICLLTTNHRNAIEIHRFSEDYRREGLNKGENPGPESRPYRKGVQPQIISGSDSEALADFLAAHVKYQVAGEKRPPESIAIICSRNAHLQTMQILLARTGLESITVRNNSFKFAEPGAVRLSTLHSAKGLEFDSVFIYLPEMPPAREIDPAYQERMYRNLVYVAMTRARDSLQIFADRKIRILDTENEGQE